MPMDPEKRRAALEHVVQAARTAFGPGLRSVVVKGSALTEDFIPGYSDLDVHVYVAPALLRGPRVPRLGPAVAFQRALGEVDPEDYGVSSFQLYFVDAESYPEDWQKPLPGTYEVVHGEPIEDREPVATRLAKAHRHLRKVPEWTSTLIARFVDKPDTEVPGLVRLAGVFLKGAVLSAAALATGRPEVIAGRTVDDLLERLRGQGVDTAPAAAFFTAVREWDALQRDLEECRETFRQAVEAMDALTAWHAERFPEKDPAA